MAIQRFTWTYDEITPDKNGRWVAHDDHLTALRKQREGIGRHLIKLWADKKNVRAYQLAVIEYAAELYPPIIDDDAYGQGKKGEEDESRS